LQVMRMRKSGEGREIFILIAQCFEEELFGKSPTSKMTRKKLSSFLLTWKAFCFTNFLECQFFLG